MTGATASKAAGLPYRRLLLVLAPAFLLGACYGFGDIIRDCALTCNVGYRYAPYAFLAVAGATLPAISVQLHLIARWGYWAWQRRSLLAVAVSLLLFRVLLYYLFRGEALAQARGQDPATWTSALRYTYIGFYVWLDLAFSLLYANLFGLMRKVHAGDAERGLGYTAVALLAGGLLGSWLAGPLNTGLHHWLLGRFEIARDHLLIVMSAILLATLPLVAAIGRQAAAAPAGTGDLPAAPAALGTVWGWVRADRRLTALAGFFFVTGAASIALTYLFFWVVNDQTDPNRVAFFSSFYVWLNAFSLFMLSFGTARLMRRLGLAFVLVSLPAILLAGTTYLAFFTVLWVMLALRIASEGLSAALYEPATEQLLLTTVDAERYDLLRPFLDNLGTRAGEALAALLILALAFGFDASQWAFILLLAVLNLAWLGAVLWLRRLQRA